MKKIALLGALALASSLASAQSAPLRSNLFVNIGYGAGGDTLASVQMSDGSVQSIKAGKGLTLKGGVEFWVGQQATFQVSAAYQVDDTSATNGNVTFSRWPIEGLLFWNLSDQVRVGGGLRKATSAKLKGSGVASGFGTYLLESSTGIVLEGEYLFTPRAGITLRYVKESFTVNGGPSISGDHVGMGLNYHF
jgi:hypothetical protein